MRLCVVVPNYLPHFGGAEVGMHLILRHFASEGHECHVISPITDAALPLYEIIDGVTVHRYRRPELWARWYAPTLYAFRHTGRIMRAIQADVVLISYILPTGLAGYYAARQQRLPLVMALVGHDIYDPFHMPDGLLQRWSAWAIQRTRHIIASSTFIRDRLISHFGAKPEQVRVIPYGIEAERYASPSLAIDLHAKYNIPAGAVLLFALQRLELRKGTDILIRAMQRVAQENPDAHLLIGGKGRSADELHALVHEQGLAGRVTFAGFIPEDEKAAHYAGADAFVLHSYHEGLGIVIQEAAAAGLPVVSTSAGGTLDVVREGETGRLVAPGDVAALSAAMLELAGDAGLRQRMGQAGQVFVRERFSVQAVAAQFMMRLEEAMRL